MDYRFLTVRWVAFAAGLLVLSQLLGSSAFADRDRRSCIARALGRIIPHYEPVPIDQALATFGSGTARALDPDSIRFFIWNTHKGKDPRWLDDLTRGIQNSDLALIQEAAVSPITRHPLSEIMGRQWSMAGAFSLTPIDSQWATLTGVATASTVDPVYARALQSVVREPITGTPKTAILTRYPVGDDEAILSVINIHAINFTPLSRFNRQLVQIEEAIEQSPGPLVLAGDFNTWSRGRRRELSTLAKRNGLVHVVFPKDPRKLRFDHVYMRGLKIKKLQIQSGVQSSDHFPLFAEFCLPSSPCR